MSTTELTCSHCGAALREADLDVRQGTATCRFCGALTRLPAEPAIVPFPAPPVVSLPVPVPESAAARPKVPRPESVAYSLTANGIQLTYRWFSPILFFLLFFCIAWDGFLVFWYSMGIAGAGQMGAAALIFLLFPICHVAVGIGLTYFVLAGFLNRTWIDATRDGLRVRHGPVPWRGNKTLAAENIDQLFCSFSGQNSESSHSYCVSVLLKDGRKEKLISMLHADDEARYIERTIEEFYGMEHHPVAGELA